MLGFDHAKLTFRHAGRDFRLTDVHGHVVMVFFFFNDTAATDIYTLSLHDALPISAAAMTMTNSAKTWPPCGSMALTVARSEEHTSELQSRGHLVCRLLLEKKKQLHYPTVTSQKRKCPQI